MKRVERARFAVPAEHAGRIKQLPVEEERLTRLPLPGDTLTSRCLVEPHSGEPLPVRVLDVKLDASPEYIVVVIAPA